MTSTPPFAPRTRTTQEPELDLTSIVVIHRAIRHDLRRLTACLAEIPDRGAPSSQAHAIRRYAAALFAEICQHLDNEDGILWPVIAATAGQAVDLTPLTDDHQAIEAAIGRALQALASFRTDPGPPGDLHASVTELRNMLDEHITDEEQQILPAMRRYLPAEAYRSCEKQIQRKTPLAGIWFTAPWLARHAHPDELSRPLAAGGWPGRILLAAARPGYARLERQAFCTRPADDTRHLPTRSFRSSPGGTMLWSYPRRPPSPADLGRRHPGRLRGHTPRPVEALSRRPATVHAATAGGLAVWQIVLIGVGVPLAAAVVTALLRRIRSERRISARTRAVPGY